MLSECEAKTGRLPLKLKAQSHTIQGIFLPIVLAINVNYDCRAFMWRTFTNAICDLQTFGLKVFADYSCASVAPHGCARTTFSGAWYEADWHGRVVV